MPQRILRRHFQSTTTEIWTMRATLYCALLLPAALLLLLQGCASVGHRLPEPAQVDALPPVAAAFRTRIEHDGHKEVSDWRFWRSADRVQRENLQSRTGELWQRDGATLFHALLFHAERRGVEFEQADLQMTGSGSSWAQRAQIVSPALLQRLRMAKAGRMGKAPFQEYSGEVDGVRWRIRMRTDLMLPVRIEQRRASETLSIELIESHPLALAPWLPPVAEGYSMVDFADLGDHERDPFVLRLQAFMGIGHGHAH
jgi:hypothetical protein